MKQIFYNIIFHIYIIYIYVFFHYVLFYLAIFVRYIICAVTYSFISLHSQSWIVLAPRLKFMFETNKYLDPS